MPLAHHAAKAIKIVRGLQPVEHVLDALVAAVSPLRQRKHNLSRRVQFGKHARDERVRCRHVLLVQRMPLVHGFATYFVVGEEVAIVVDEPGELFVLVQPIEHCFEQFARAPPP